MHAITMPGTWVYNRNDTSDEGIMLTKDVSLWLQSWGSEGVDCSLHDLKTILKSYVEKA